jgi:hypothetical protein
MKTTENEALTRFKEKELIPAVIVAIEKLMNIAYCTKKTYKKIFSHR